MSEKPARQRDPERTRAELLAEATAAFAENGFAGTSVDEIAERSSSTKRMIYYYFGNKEGLYLAVLENAYRGIREAERAVDVTGLEPVEALRRIAELTYEYHREHSDFIRIVSIENIHRGKFVRKLDSLRTLNAPALQRLEEILRRGREQGLVRSDIDPLDVHMLISSYCVFQIANQYTFGHLFDMHMQAPEQHERLRALIGDATVAWATQGV